MFIIICLIIAVSFCASLYVCVSLSISVSVSLFFSSGGYIRRLDHHSSALLPSRRTQQ